MRQDTGEYEQQLAVFRILLNNYLNFSYFFFNLSFYDLFLSNLQKPARLRKSILTLSSLFLLLSEPPPYLPVIYYPIYTHNTIVIYI